MDKQRPVSSLCLCCRNRMVLTPYAGRTFLKVTVSDFCSLICRFPLTFPRYAFLSMWVDLFQHAGGETKESTGKNRQFTCHLPLYIFFLILTLILPGFSINNPFLIFAFVRSDYKTISTFLCGL